MLTLCPGVVEREVLANDETGDGGGGGAVVGKEAIMIRRLNSNRHKFLLWQSRADGKWVLAGRLIYRGELAGWRSDKIRVDTWQEGIDVMNSGWPF